MPDELSGTGPESTSPSFDFDEDAIASLLDTFVETQTGPQNKHVSRPPRPDDAGAQAAQRTVFQQPSRHEALPLVGDTDETKSRRVALLRALAAGAVGSTRARLLTSAAELCEQLGDSEGALRSYQEAQAADARDVVVLHALQRHWMRLGSWPAAAEALEKEAALGLGGARGASTLKLLAQIRLSKLGDAAAAERAALRATELDATDFVAWMLLAAARIARGQGAHAARALTCAADSWPESDGKPAILLHAAELMERSGEAEEAMDLFEKVLTLRPGSHAAQFGMVRTARQLGHTEAAIGLLSRAARDFPPPIAGALRRAAAAMAHRNRRDDDAISLLASAKDIASVWTLAEIQAWAGDLRAAAESLAADTIDRTIEIEGIDTLRRARFVRDLGEQQVEAKNIHPAFESYLRALMREADAAEPAHKHESEGTGKASADEAARSGDRARFANALQRELEDADPSTALGAALAAAEAVESADRATTLRTAEERLPNHPLLRRVLILAERDPARNAQRWRDEAREADGPRSAFASTMAATLADGPEALRHACQAALDCEPAYPPALWHLELAANSDDARARAAALQAEIDLSDAVGHRLRAAIWTPDPDERGRHAEAALDPTDPDPLVLEHLFEAAGRFTERAGEWMRFAASALGSNDYLGRAAESYRAAGLSEPAAKALREASKAAPDDVTLRVRRQDAELEASEFARWAESVMGRARHATGETEALSAFRAMADVDRLARLDMQSARLSLQSIAEVRPEHVPTARALEWDALRECDAERVRSSARRLICALPPGSADRIARMRLIAELSRSDPDFGQSEIDRTLCGFDDALEADPGLARQVLGAAYARADAELGLQALIALQASVEDDLERAAFALEAAQLLEASGDTGRALEALNTAGNHPLALEAEARLLAAAKRWTDAAASYREAASRSKDPRRAAAMWREAACIFEEALSNRTEAIEAWVAAARCDITYRDVYRRLSALYESEGRIDDLAQLTDARIEAGADTPTLVGLLLDKAEQHQERGDAQGVAAALNECLELDPHHFEALRRLVEVHRSDGDWQGAAQSLIRIARLKRSQSEQLWAFSRLAEIYHEHLSDLPRAEASLRRALELAPAHTETLDRLASVLSQQERSREAARVLQHLVQRAGSDLRARDYRIRLASEMERAGDSRQAEAMLEQLRGEHPTDPDVILALADHFREQNADAAEAMHLNRAVNDLREAIEEDPGDEASWTTLVRVLGRRHGPGAASCAASAAIALGHPASLFDGDVASGGRALGKPKLPLSPVVDTIIAPKTLPQTLRRLFVLCDQAFDKMLPFDASAWRLRKPLAPHRTLIEEAGTVAAALGISEPRLRITYVAPTACMPIGSDPPTLVVGGNLQDTTTPQERAFLFARALKVAASHLAPGLRARPEELDAALAALLQDHDPHISHQPEGQQMRDLRRKLMRAVPRRWRDEVESLVLELRGNADFSTRLVPFAVSGLGDRAALTLTGDAPAAVSALLKIGGGDVPTGPARLEAAREAPEAWGLVRFAISDAHFEARAQAGVDP